VALPCTTSSPARPGPRQHAGRQVDANGAPGEAGDAPEQEPGAAPDLEHGAALTMAPHQLDLEVVEQAVVRALAFALVPAGEVVVVRAWVHDAA
jgi:hypothetical protein